MNEASLELHESSRNWTNQFEDTVAERISNDSASMHDNQATMRMCHCVQQFCSTYDRLDMTNVRITEQAETIATTDLSVSFQCYKHKLFPCLI